MGRWMAGKIYFIFIIQQLMQDPTQTPFEVLDREVYPVLNEALHKLINHIVKTEEVHKHEQRLIQHRLLDELEVKKAEREKEKE